MHYWGGNVTASSDINIHFAPCFPICRKCTFLLQGKKPTLLAMGSTFPTAILDLTFRLLIHSFINSSHSHWGPTMCQKLLSAYDRAVNKRDKGPAFMELIYGEDTVKTNTCVRQLQRANEIEWHDREWPGRGYLGRCPWGSALELTDPRR